MTLVSVLPLVLTASIMLVVLGLGLNASRRDALSLVRHPGLLLRSLLSMNVVMPLVATILVVAFDLPLAVEIALIALSVSPVPPLLPGKEMRAGGDESYAVGLFVATALVAIVAVPLSVALFSVVFDRPTNIPPARVAKSLLTGVFLPMVVGIAVRARWPAVAERLTRPVTLLGMVLMVICVLPLVYVVWPTVRGLLGDGTALVVAAMAVAGLVSGHLLGGPAPGTRTVLALSSTARHPAIAIAVCVAGGLDLRTALAAVLLYVILATLVSIPYVIWRRRQRHAGPPLSTASRSLP